MRNHSAGTAPATNNEFRTKAVRAVTTTTGVPSSVITSELLLWSTMPLNLWLGKKQSFTRVPPAE